MRSPKREKAMTENDFYLPDSVWQEILIRLPLKSIFKFKTVSKRWLSLISAPFFGRHYSARVNNHKCQPWALVDCCFSADEDVLIPLDNGFPEFPSSGFSLSFLPTQGNTGNYCKSILAWSNCLLFLRHGGSYYICNPLTKQYVILPSPPPTAFFEQVTSGLITHDDGSYKIIRLAQQMMNYLSQTSAKFQIFSSGTGEWRESIVECPYLNNQLYANLTTQVLAYNGILHWIQLYHYGKIIAYDPCKNQFRAMDLPFAQSVIGDLLCPGICHGHLCQLALQGRKDLRLWKLNNYDKGDWQLERSSESSDLRKSSNDELNKHLPRDEYMDNLLPVAIHPFDFDTVFLHLYEGRPTGTPYLSLLSFNFRTKQLGMIRDYWDYYAARSFVLPPWPTPLPQPSQNSETTR